MLIIFCVVIAVSGIYLGQVYFYRLQLPSILPKAGLAPHKITGITADDVYDLSGSEASGGGHPFNLFDENADPANGVTTDPVTHPLPLGKIDVFYPPGKGFRMLVDLHNKYALSDLYIYDRAFETDSIWFYTGEINHWTLASSYATTSTSANWGWRRLPVSQLSRFVMIRFNSYRSMITELVLYGDLRQRLPAETMDHLPALPRISLRQFAGTNTYDNVPVQLMKPFAQDRLYQQLDYFDTDTVHAYPKNMLSLNSFHLPQQQQLRYYADSLHKLGNDIWLSIRGLPIYLEKKGMNDKDKPVTEPGMITEDPLSYGRHAKTLWTMAALFGKKKIDTNLIDVADVPKFSGLGLMNRFENGNEEDAYWTKYYWTPLDYFAVSSADYDGDEGRLGARRGLQAADSSSKLMASGMIQFDTNRTRTLYFLCRQLRHDKKFIWQGGVQYHYYSNAQQGNLQPPSRGISPEEDHMREKLSKVRAFHNRLLPGIPLILGENGYDRNQQSWQRTPVLPGYNEAQSQGILCIRSLMAAFMADFDGYNQYMMRNATNDENVPGPYGTSGMIGGPATNIVYPGWYYWSAVMEHLGNYLPDAIVSESGAVWIYRLKKAASGSKKAYMLFCPTVDGSSIKNFSFKVQGFTNESFRIIRLADKNSSGAVQAGKFVNGAATLLVNESPVMLVMD